MTNPKLSDRPRNLTCEPGTAPADLHRILDATRGDRHKIRLRVLVPEERPVASGIRLCRFRW
jgi:hypothetical protein